MKTQYRLINIINGVNNITSENLEKIIQATPTTSNVVWEYDIIAEGEGFGIKILNTNSTASGNNSISCGVNTTASGYYTTASGYQTQAIGGYSTASGQYSTTTGLHSNASGYNATASGQFSFASGYQTTASGSYSTASGYYSTSEGQHSFASGSEVMASGNYSFAFGQNTNASVNYSTAFGRQTTASGNYSTARGYLTNASGVGSNTEGYATVASGPYSHAEGYGSNATGAYSHAEGYYTIASGNYSHAGGRETSAPSYCETSIGTFTTNYTPNSSTEFNGNDRLFNIGNGFGTGLRSDALTVLKNGEITAPSLHEGIIDNESTGRVLITKEWFNKKYLANSSNNVGNTIYLDNTIGRTYNTPDLPNNNTNYALALIVNGGQAEVYINTASEPTITGGVKIKGSTFLPSTLMKMNIRNNGVRTEYYFAEL